MKETWKKGVSIISGKPALEIEGVGESDYYVLEEKLIDKILHAREASEILEEIYESSKIDGGGKSEFVHIIITHDILDHLRQWGKMRRLQIGG